MYIIKRLPILLPLIASVVLGFFGIRYNFDLQEFSAKLIFSIVVFYLGGYYLRNIIIGFLVRMLKENEKKAELIRQYEAEKRYKKRKALIHSETQDNDFEPYSPEKLER